MFIAIVGQPVQKSNLINAWCRIIEEEISNLRINQALSCM